MYLLIYLFIDFGLLYAPGKGPLPVLPPPSHGSRACSTNTGEVNEHV